MYVYSYCNALSARFFTVDRALNSYIMIIMIITCKNGWHEYAYDCAQARFYVGAEGGNCPRNLSLTSKTLVIQQQYAVVKQVKSYTGGVFWRVGVLACVLRATTEKRSSTCLAPEIFFSKNAPDCAQLQHAIQYPRLHTLHD